MTETHRWADKDGYVFTTPEVVQTWLPGDPVIKSMVWCWAHRSWEFPEEVGYVPGSFPEAPYPTGRVPKAE